MLLIFYTLPAAVLYYLNQRKTARKDTDTSNHVSPSVANKNKKITVNRGNHKDHAKH
jgi:hypothetical protein